MYSVSANETKQGNTPYPDPKKDKPKQRNVFATLFSGGCAGALAKTTIAPLDRTKIIFQVSNTPFSYKAAGKILYDGYKKNGFLSWWRGNSATMMRIAPYSAMQFTTHEQFKMLLGGSSTTVLPPFRRFLAGSLAGLSACSCTYPLDLVRARMAVTGKTKYLTLRQAFTTIYKQEGLMAFYHGFVPTLFGIMPYAGTSFFVYETLKDRFHRHYPGKELGTWNRLSFGAAAGMCGQFFTYPLDIVRRRMQTDGIDGKGYKYRSALDTLRYVLNTEGFLKGLYKGLSINWIKGPIAVGISFTTFDNVNRLIEILFSDEN